jgi:hypothetical protein
MVSLSNHVLVDRPALCHGELVEPRAGQQAPLFVMVSLSNHVLVNKPPLFVMVSLSNHVLVTEPRSLSW